MIQSLTVLAFLAGSAFAADPAPAPVTGPALQDCVPLTDATAKATCEKANQLLQAQFDLAALKACAGLTETPLADCTKKKGELEALIASLAPAAQKGGKAQRSDTNHMEEEATGAE